MPVLLKRFERTGEIPGMLLEEPELNPYLLEFFAHFARLDASRTGGFGPNPLQFVEMEAYCRIYGIKGKQKVRDFIFLMREMDREFLSHAAEKQSDK